MKKATHLPSIVWVKAMNIQNTLFVNACRNLKALGAISHFCQLTNCTTHIYVVWHFQLTSLPPFLFLILFLSSFAAHRLSWFSPVFQPLHSSSRFLLSYPSWFTTAAVTAVMQAGTRKRKMTMPVVAMDMVARRGGASAVSHGCLWQLWLCAGNVP